MQHLQHDTNTEWRLMQWQQLHELGMTQRIAVTSNSFQTTLIKMQTCQHASLLYICSMHLESMDCVSQGVSGESFFCTISPHTNTGTKISFSFVFPRKDTCMWVESVHVPFREMHKEIITMFLCVYNFAYNLDPHEKPLVSLSTETRPLETFCQQLLPKTKEVWQEKMYIYMFMCEKMQPLSVVM